MATSVDRAADNTDTPPPDDEPGASTGPVLLRNDTFDDFSLYDTEDERHSHLTRLPSGTIDEIRGKQDPEDSGSTGTASSVSRPGTPADPAPTFNCKPADKENQSNHAESDTDSLGTTDNEKVKKVEELDYVHTGDWKLHRKHIFILSEAGKPIYSRYGTEDKLVTIMGVMQALVSFVQDNQDSLNCITAGEHKFVFLVRDHLILVAVSNTTESMHQLLLQLKYVHNQVLSVLTLSQLKRIFKQRHNYDLRRLLTGAEKFFDNLLHLIDTDPSFMLGAVRCLSLDPQVRENIAQSICQNAKVKDLVFAILITNDNQLITLVRMRKYFLHPLDLHLIFNLVSASESFKAAESWTPICLPKFDSGGYLHGHISYIDESSQVCLLLLTVDRDVFFTLSDCKEKILARMNKYNCLKSIHSAIEKNQYSMHQVGVPDLQHFLYKSKSASQFTSPALGPPYVTEEEQARLFGMYKYLYNQVHNRARPLKIVYHVGAYETLLGWVTSGFELYAVFGPLVTKQAAITSINKLLKWIKKEEDQLFILNSPTF